MRMQDTTLKLNFHPESLISGFILFFIKKIDLSFKVFTFFEVPTNVRKTKFSRVSKGRLRQIQRSLPHQGGGGKWDFGKCS